MHRRGFLGIFGAGAVAGPKLAAGIVQDVATNMPMPPMGVSSGGLASSAPDGWRLKRIATLKNIISGKDPEAEKQQKMQRLFQAENCERVRLDGLRSVSPGHKMRMLVDSHHDRQERIRRTDAMFSLASIMRGED